MLKMWQIIFLPLILVVVLNACGNSNANNQTGILKDAQQKTETVSQQAPPESTSVIQSELDKAKNAGKAVFLVVTGTGVTNVDKATEIAKGAKAIYKNALILQMNRDEAANAQLVADWRLSGAPVPLILVISSKGTPTGGYILEQATSENIAALVPSPKLELVYEAIKNGKNSIVVFSKKTFSDKAEVLKECKEAVLQLNNEAVLVEVDMDDVLEKGFMKQVKINPNAAKGSITLVINKKGQVAGTSTTLPDATKLVAAAKTPVKSGCGPGCGPAGCGK